MINEETEGMTSEDLLKHLTLLQESIEALRGHIQQDIELETTPPFYCHHIERRLVRATKEIAYAVTRAEKRVSRDAEHVPPVPLSRLDNE